MPPVPASNTLPRLIVYHQTHHDRSGKHISALPLLHAGVSHVYIAAIHLNDLPENITLNDHHPDHERNNELWSEVRQLQDAGIKCLGMLGGAAKGSYERLARDFEAYYLPLRDLIRAKKFDGLDLDIEEPTQLSLTQTLLQRLHTDFGPDFILTLAPVMPALLPIKPYLASFCYRLLHPELPPAAPLIRSFIKAHLLGSHRHLSGFNHFELESSVAGQLVHWYNVQFYCGWGDAGDAGLYEAIVASGWNSRKVVLGVITNPENGSGHVELDRMERCVATLMQKYGNNFGGVMAWEYFNAGGSKNMKPEEWVGSLASMLGRSVAKQPIRASATASSAAAAAAETEARTPVLNPSDTRDIQVAMQDASLIGKQAASTSATSETSRSTGSASQSQTATSAGGDHNAKVQRLVDMGFDRAEAVAALEAMGGDVDAAASILFSD